MQSIFLPNPYQDLDADQTERAILFESVPRCDPDCTVLSPDPVRGLVLLHMGIGEGSGQLITRGEKRGGKSKEGEGEKVREVDVRSELLGEIVGLSQEMMNWMDSKKGQPMPRNLKSTDIRKLGAERPTETQVYKHYVMMREYFKTYILDDLGTFLRLQQNEHYQKALCDVMSWLYSDDCGGCMNYRLQQSFSRRIIEHESAALAAAATSSSSLDIPQPKKKDLTLTKDEFLCLNSLHFAIPQHVDGLKPMLPYIAARIDPDDVVDGHSIQCRELHSLPLTLGSMYTFMWESCPGGIAILEAGGIDQIGRLDVYDNTKISGIDTSIAHEFQERMEKEKSEEIDDDDSDGSVDEEELSPSSLHKSSLIQAHDIITSKTKESMDAILKTPPLDWIWMVQLTDRALGTFRRMKRKNLRNFVPVMKNIDMIARGFWTDSTACSLVADTKVVLYESKVLNNLRIVWQVEVAYLEINRMHSQVIRIHSIGNHKDVVNAVEYIQAAQRAYSKTRIDRCKERPKDNRGFVTPLTWRDDGDDSKHIVEFSREDMENPLKVLKMHEQAVTAKFFPLSKMMLCWLIDGAKDNEETEFPFSVSEQEDEILNHRNSVIVVGRSGTGKTSCSVFRLLSNWHARRVDFKQGGHIANSVGMNPLFLLEDGESKKPRFRFRQIFVTASPKFCGRVQAYYQTLSKSLNPGGDEHVLAELIDMINKPDDEGATNIIHEFGQDESLTVEEELAKMDSGDDVTTSSPKSPDEFWDKEEDYIQRLPKSFGDLKDSDFPLFVHYKKLLSMIRVYLGLEEDVTFAEGEAAERNADFERFKEIYHSLDRNLTLGMDASLVFSEIMGVIKGSEMAAVSAEGKLSREEYCNLSTRAHATFKETRDQIYDIFEAYNQKKLERFQAYVNGKLEFLEVPRKLDEQDRVNEVNRLIAKMTAEKNPRLAAVMFNQVYLDEVQDLTMAQILPLVTCVRIQIMDSCLPEILHRSFIVVQYSALKI
ncbi:hypothetical protein BCR33DRAFT_341959 [Rhizoclosmatium globosum]|uniref:Uncharacterized protein n=1 Tax=Rhizoclosmatium globosum TaxID=329046 RepID=A0A1Y2C2U2_9FUNG|nr:hypothetical protein BCR33DRAFT_341959 [Rhizoclosmatium globosum]|eukprot:ORY41204.1 hypothetical protein BCR33DRAFT_341959 [Rhizoclosmatium globosum]